MKRPVIRIHSIALAGISVAIALGLSACQEEQVRVALQAHRPRG